MSALRAVGGAPRRAPWPALLAVAVIVLVASLLPRAWEVAEPPPPAPPPATAALVVAAPRPVPSAAAAPAVATARRAVLAPAVDDATALDLRRLHDTYADDSDARKRRMAARAFHACVPLFVAPRGETPSVEALAAALPARDRAQREQALRTLYARCRGFVGERPETIAAMDRRWREDVPAQDAGDRATETLLAGDAPALDRVLAGAFAANDPASVAALGGIAMRLAAARQGQGASADRQRAAAVDAALPLVACDLGLDCGAQSLAALQACALHAACGTDPGTRLSAPGGADAAAVEAERLRLRELLARGVPVTSDDLLPPEPAR